MFYKIAIVTSVALFIAICAFFYTSYYYNKDYSYNGVFVDVGECYGYIYKAS